MELYALQQKLPEITAAGSSLVAITAEQPDHSMPTVEKNQLTFEVLSDIDNQVARQFGLVFQIPEDLREVYAGFGIDLPGTQGNDRFELAIPATFVIDRNGKVVTAFVDPDYTKRLEPDEIVATLQGL